MMTTLTANGTLFASFLRMIRRRVKAVRPIVYAVRLPRQGTIALCDSLEDAERSINDFQDAMLFDMDGACLYR